jgi:uncharacterized HAD superfamily protein
MKHFSDFRLKFDGTVLSDVSGVKNRGMYFDKTISIGTASQYDHKIVFSPDSFI